MSKLQANFDSKDVEILSREKIHEGFVRLDCLQLRHRLYDNDWSEALQRELLIKSQAVGILLFDPRRDEIVLVRQFRVGMIDEKQSPWLLELVAGMVTEGEQLLEVAIRETNEESNCVPTNLVEICAYYNSPGVSNEKITLYCGQVDAKNAGGIFGLKAEHEDIEVVVLSYDDVLAAVKSGAINNAMTIIAVQWLQLNKQELLHGWKQLP